MKRSQEVLTGIASAVIVLGLIGWGIWAWLNGAGSDTRVQSIVIKEQNPDRVEQTNSPPPIEDASIPDLPMTTERWSGVERITPETPEPPLGADEIVCPVNQTLTILQTSPDSSYKTEISGRTWESFGLVKFDLSDLSGPPTKAILKACVYTIENTGGRQTPARLVFYRLKTDWDDSATYRYAKARDQEPWQNGTFNPKSPADLDLSPIAVFDITNPPAPGFNVQVDITPVVVGWMSGQYPNCGLLMRTEQGRGLANQANLATRRYTSTHFPQIFCTVATPRESPDRSTPSQSSGGPSRAVAATQATARENMPMERPGRTQ